jgi:type IV secretory pathway TraG/TraD family ATPase VirD4
MTTGQYLGTTLIEHGIGRQGVFLDSHHYLTLAGTGSGKSVSSIWPNLCLGDYSGGLVISPKPEHAQLASMRHADPGFFELGAKLPEKASAVGVDPRKSVTTRFHVPNSRSFCLDPGGQTGQPTHCYTFLSDVDPKKPGAAGRLMAIAAGSFPENPHAKDPWFTNAPRAALAASCGHLITANYHVSEQTLPNALRRLMGVDPLTGIASPKCQQNYLEEIRANSAFGGQLQIAASAVYGLGENAFGTLNSELQTRCSWMLDPGMERVLSGPSDFRMEEVGVDRWPVMVFAIPPRGEPAAYAWLRTLYELSTLVWQQRTKVPKKPLLVVADEMKLWGKEVTSVKDSLAVVRDVNVKLWIYAQNYPQLVAMYTECGAQEILSACTLQAFGCSDPGTRRMIRERLGKTTIRRHQGAQSRDEIVDLVSDDAIDRELSVSSPLQYVIPTHLPPMRLGRLGHKAVKTKQGLRLQGLPLGGHYEDRVEEQEDDE